MYKDGGVAILDQIICSYAKYFMGSYESTFSFRIQEEREIMGFPVETTFDMLCKTGEFNCEKGSKWKIVYPQTKSQHTELWIVIYLIAYPIYFFLNELIWK